MRFYPVIFDGERMANYKVFVVLIASIFIWGCSKTPVPIVKEEVQLSSQEDLEYLKQTSENAPLEIDLYQAIAIAIKNVIFVKIPFKYCNGQIILLIIN